MTLHEKNPAKDGISNLAPDHLKEINLFLTKSFNDFKSTLMIFHT